MTMTKNVARGLVIIAGSAYLREWFTRTLETGTIHYTVPHVSRSGMSRDIKLFRVTTDHSIDILWPGLSLATPDEAIDAVGGYSKALAIVAKDWGFNFNKRAFVVGGCGMDMVFALIDNLGYKAGIDNLGNRLRRESIG